MNSSKENISELLRTVDKVIKSGALEQATGLIDRILELSPKNIYARAYRERIEELQKAQRSEPSEAPPIAAAAVTEEQGETAAAPVIPSKHEQKLSDAVIEAYKTLLNEIWKDGDISPLEMERHNTMREFFAISQDEHDYLDQNARLTSYLNAVKDSWNKGARDFTRIKTLFRITEQEEVILQHKVDRLIKSLNSKGVILSLDDDKNFLLLVERLLEKNGYHSLNTTSGEEALNLLENFTPDLVLCDIAFGQKNMNGFMFYEQFRSIERFASVPFIFISALNQKDLIKTGKKIGVDDYITKPVDNDVLLAAIEGRIRRVREMKKAVDF
jgi:CheY-like chemotaxis protein